MSQLYVKVQTGFYMHRKTLLLETALGDDAFWIPPRLWAFAAEHRPDGIFENYSAKQIAKSIGYTRDASRMLKALLKAGFLDSNPLRIHGWDEHNQYHKTFADRAKKAAAARWQKSPSIPTPDKDKDKDRGVSIASSNASSIPLVSATAAKISDERELERIAAQLKQLGGLNDYAAGSIKYNRVRELTTRQTALLKKWGMAA